MTTWYQVIWAIYSGPESAKMVTAPLMPARRFLQAGLFSLGGRKLEAQSRLVPQSGVQSVYTASDRCQPALVCS